MKKYIFAAVLSLALLASPAFTQAAALTQTQINAIVSLLQSFGADSTTIANVNTALNGDTTVIGDPKPWCHTFSTNIKIGDQSEEVTNLDRALIREGFLNQDEVFQDGRQVLNFDETTAAAVVQFQAKYGIRQTGYVGPITRAKLNKLYGCSNPVPPSTFSASPTSGGAPLAVMFYSNTQGGTVNFGDGTPSTSMECDTASTANSSSVSSACLRTFTRHTYTAPGIYTATLQALPQCAVYAGQNDSSNCKPVTIGKITITVTDETTQPPINVLSPNGGEQWQKGSTQNITWNPAGAGMIDIRLVSYYPPCTGTVCTMYYPVPAEYMIATQTANDGVFEWGVGKSLDGKEIPEGKYTIRVSRSIGAYEVSDESDAPFSIVAGTTTTTQSIAIYRSPATSPTNPYKVGDATVSSSVNSPSFFSTDHTGTGYNQIGSNTPRTFTFSTKQLVDSGACNAATGTCNIPGNWSATDFVCPAGVTGVQQMTEWYTIGNTSSNKLTWYFQCSTTTPTSSYTPVGSLDGTDNGGTASGWAVDPDSPTTSISVHFYIDGAAGQGGTYAGSAVANLANSTANSAGYPGSHGYSFSIPQQWRDGKPHTLYAHGIDLSGDGSKNILLSNVPKSFTLGTVTAPTPALTVSPTTFAAGASATITVANAAPNATVKVFCRDPNGAVCDNPVSYTTNSSGQFSHTYNTTGWTLGTYRGWVTVNGVQSNTVTFTVTAPPLTENVIYQPPSQHYAYAPAAIRTSDSLHVWTCYNRDAGNMTDYILHVSNGASEIVLSPTSGAWDARHTCDPSITRGTFVYQGHTYPYALFYLGTDKDFGHNQVGVAYSNSLVSPEQWVKYPLPLVTYPDDGTWGVGQPSATSIANGRVLLFYTKNANTFVREIDLGDASHPNVGAERQLTTTGAQYLNGGQDLLRNLDLAYDPTRDVFFAVRDQLTNGSAQTYPNYITPNINLSWLPGTGAWGGGGSWTALTSITPAKTGYPRNHNAGIIRSEYGTLPDPQKVEVLYSTSCSSDTNASCTTAEWSYHISSFTAPLSAASIPTTIASLFGGANQTASVSNAVSGLVAGNSTSQASATTFTYTWNRDLQIGSPYQGDVIALQQALTREGVYAGEITGGFYNQTYAAVKSFQQKYGIEATGFVGPLTRAELNTLFAR